MRKNIYHKIIAAIIVITLFNVRTSFAQDNQQLNLDTGLSSSLPELIDIKSTNSSLKLDSIYEDLNIGYKTIKRKWLFNYSNNKLVSKEHLFYSTDYSSSLNLREEWFYNERGQEIIFQERNTVTSLSDSLFIVNIEENTYEGDFLILKKSKSISRSGASSHVENGELVWEYTIDYRESLTNYLFNDDGNLYLEYNEPNKDSVFYYYNDNGHLQMKIEKKSPYNSLYVEKYEYDESNTMKHISKKFDGIYNTTDVSNIENINLQQEYIYDYELNENGKPGKITVTANNYGFSSYDSQTLFEYNPNGQPVLISIYFWGTLSSTESGWYEQARLKYTYDDDGNISCYQMYFYDDRLHDWVIGEQKIYFYSSFKSATSNYQASEIEVNIYPNPVNETIYLSVELEKGANYVIYDYSGRKVSEGSILNNSINVENMSKGLYFIKIFNSQPLSVCKFFKE
jgi:hypothetical protein